MNSPLLVAHVITKLELGGAQINTLYTYENLDSARFQTWLVSGPGGMLEPAPEHRQNWRIAGHLGRPIRPLRDWLALKELTRILKQIDPAIVHTHSSKAGILGRLAARFAGTPVIVHTVHGFSFSPHQPWLKRTLLFLAEKAVARFTTHFIFVSEDDRKTGRRLMKIGDNCSLIRSGFPLEPFRKPPTAAGEIKARYAIPAGAPVCGVIAPFKPQKGLDHLLEIAARVVRQRPDVIFFLAGVGDLRPMLEGRLREKGIAENFRLPGFIRDLAPVVDMFDIGVSTALWEGLPQSLVQLRLKKKPAVVSDIAGNRCVIRQNENGFLVSFSDHQAFAEKILALLNDQALRRRLGEYPDDYAEFDARRMVERQMELYDCLLARSKN